MLIFVYEKNRPLLLAKGVYIYMILNVINADIGIDKINLLAEIANRYIVQYS